MIEDVRCEIDRRMEQRLAATSTLASLRLHATPR